MSRSGAFNRYAGPVITKKMDFNVLLPATRPLFFHLDAGPHKNGLRCTGMLENSGPGHCQITLDVNRASGRFNLEE